MSDEFTGEAERVMVSLDAVGNTTKAITKGVAIGSAVIAAVALFSSFIETIGNQLHNSRTSRVTRCSTNPLTQINVAVPNDLHRPVDRWIDRLPLLVACYPGRRPLGGTVVYEVRRQFREHPGIMDYNREAGIRRVISICTAASSARAHHPGLAGGSLACDRRVRINYIALGAFLTGTILTGQLDGELLSNSGGALTTPRSTSRTAISAARGPSRTRRPSSVDTVGDPFKDTAGPALNPLIKVMNLVSLLILPAVITLRHHDGARFAIAAVALVILLTSIAFSKRSTSMLERRRRGPRN